MIVIGFIRLATDFHIPTEIVEYCMIYTFLALNDWFNEYHGKYWIIENKQAMRQKSRYNYFQTIYATPEISRGKHEWRIKIIKDEGKGIIIGISSNTDCGDLPFYGNHHKSKYSYGYSGDGKICHNWNSEKKWGDKTKISEGDIITVHLNMNELKIGFSRNGNYKGIAFSNIKDTSYRLVISVKGGLGHGQGHTHCFEMLDTK